MQDPFSQEHFIDDFKNKQIINAIFFSNIYTSRIFQTLLIQVQLPQKRPKIKKGRKFHLKRRKLY